MDIFEGDRFDTLKLLRFLYGHRRIILLASVLGFVVSVVITFFIPPKFFSAGIVYPTASNVSETVSENPQFGYEVHSDHLMQILESEVIRDSIVKRFNLVEYYELDTTRLDWRFKLDKHFVRDVQFFRSKYLSVVISARMRDPYLSAEIVNAIIDLVDGVRGNIFKANILTALTSLESEYATKNAYVNSLADSLATVQAAYLKNENPQTEVALAQLNRLLRYEQGQLLSIKHSLEKAQNANMRPIPSVYVIDRAVPHLRKISPSYRTNALIGTGGMFLFAILLLIFRERFRTLRSKIIEK
jgi:uncharacterized protein involved in exopolysaccharide biosynthesis